MNPAPFAAPPMKPAPFAAPRFAAPLIRGARAEGERGVLFLFSENRNPPALRATPLVRGARAC
jgi:hypothetical protein